MEESFRKIWRTTRTGIFITILSATIFVGCATDPFTPLRSSDGNTAVLSQMMARKNKIVHLSAETNRDQPALLLLHGATEDPGEMIDIVRDWKTSYDVFLYSYNYHQSAEKVAASLVKEMKRLKTSGIIRTNLAIVTFSYSAIIFRTAVVLEKGESVFSNAALIQLVPTAGGSALARSLKNPIAASLVALASKPSGASNPNGRFAKRLWGKEGSKKFYNVIKPEKMWSILLEGDSHALVKSDNKIIREHYQNGIGTNIVIIPASTRITHEYLPTDPIARSYLKSVLLQEKVPGAVMAKKTFSRQKEPN